jgi:sugar/nucleoside kinase (ribokinase family)
MDNALDELMKVIRRVDIIIINDEEALQLSGKDTLFAAAKEISVFWP